MSVCTCVYMCTCMCMCMCMSMCTCVCMCVCMCVCTCMCMCACMARAWRVHGSWGIVWRGGTCARRRPVGFLPDMLFHSPATAAWPLCALRSSSSRCLSSSYLEIQGRYRGDEGEMKGRYRGDIVLLLALLELVVPGDIREIWGRYKGDVGEI